MLNNELERLNIWLGLGDRFDYTEFKFACNKVGIEPQPALEFAQKAGMLSCATLMYPELPVSEAYLKFIQENQNMPQSIYNHTSSVSSKPCGSCGGGKVL